MSRAVRVGVPLKSRCSRKCEHPAWRVVSSRLPAATQTPKATERTPGTCSETTRSPPGSTVRRTSPPSGSRSRVRVLPTRWSEAGRANSGLDGLGRGGVGRLLARGPLVHDRDERELAAGVDLGDLNLHLVADLDDVLDILDPLAAGDLAQLRDVQQPILAWEQRDEGAERRGLDHGA